MPPPWGWCWGRGRVRLARRVRAPLPGQVRSGAGALAAGLGAVGAGQGGGGPAQRGAELLGVDLGDLVLGAVLVGPAALLGAADHDHPGALVKGLGGVGGLVAPDGDGVEAGFALCPAAVGLAGAGGDGDAEVGDLQAAGGGAGRIASRTWSTSTTRMPSGSCWCKTTSTPTHRRRCTKRSRRPRPSGWPTGWSCTTRQGTAAG